MSADLYGLVLTGGHSRRMQRDKAALAYAGKPQLARAMELLQPWVVRRFVSVRADQYDDPQRAAYERIVDRLADLGPLGGIHAALSTHPDKAWLVLACDLPFLGHASLERLIAQRAPQRLATAYRSGYDGQPEPLCAIYEPASLPAIESWIAAGKQCPRALLASADVRLLELADPRALDNINTADEYREATATPLRRIQVRYFALLREQAGCSGEQLATQARSAAELYEELRARHRLSLASSQLRVAINEEFADWGAPLADGDSVAFLPPVAGG